MDWLVVSFTSLALLGLACGTAPLDPDDGSSGDESTGAPASEGDSSEGSTTTPVEDGPDCAPANPALSLRFDSDGIGGSCVVIEPIDGAAISFECESTEGAPNTGSLFVDVDPQLPILVARGAELNIEVVMSEAVWEEPTPRYSVFARHGQTNELVFAAIDANNLDWVGELSPLVLTPIDAACGSHPDDSNCRATERLMWNAEHDGEIVPVGDASRSNVGGYAVHIQRAADGMFLECIDVETDFYEALIVRTQ